MKAWWEGGPRFVVVVVRPTPARRFTGYSIRDRAYAHREVPVRLRRAGPPVMCTSDRAEVLVRVLELEGKHHEWMSSLATLPPSKETEQSAP